MICRPEDLALVQSLLDESFCWWVEDSRPSSRPLRRGDMRASHLAGNSWRLFCMTAKCMPVPNRMEVKRGVVLEARDRVSEGVFAVKTLHSLLSPVAHPGMPHLRNTCS